MNRSKSIKNDYQYFKAVIGRISEEVDLFGNFKEVLSLEKVCLEGREQKAIADSVLINRNKSSECLFEIAKEGVRDQEITFYGKILEYKEVVLYEGMKFLRTETHCRIGYIKEITIHFGKKRSKGSLIDSVSTN